MQTKIALPKGRLLRKTAALLQKADWGLDEYYDEARLYHLKSQKFSSILIKMFHEKDIPIQVAVGNYDLGICGLDWIEELLVKYPSSAVTRIQNLGYGEGTLFMAASSSQGKTGMDQIKAGGNVVRIASEYPNQSENFALKNRLSRFSVFPVWGAAEVYPPESAELVLISGKTEQELADCGLVPLSRVLDFSAFLVANGSNGKSKDLNEVINSICSVISESKKRPVSTVIESRPEPSEQYRITGQTEDLVQLALPDGHQQKPTVNLLNKAGIQVDDYPSTSGNRRPENNLEGVAIKVIRPQDMPLQVANGNFDLAITGHDWMNEHLYQFPSSPVKELLDLKIGRVKIVAVVSQDLPATEASSLRSFISERTMPFRVASEYVNVADKYARDNHLGHCRIIPTWGASEAFLPVDADLLIENTETGRTIARHNLRIIDTLFESTARLIGSKNTTYSQAKAKKISAITERLHAAMEES